MGLNRDLHYEITGIDYWTIKPTANRNKEDAIIIDDIIDNGDNTVDIELLLTPVSSYIGDYMRSNNGKITIEMGNIYSGHSMLCGYRSAKNHASVKRDPQKYFHHHLIPRQKYIINRPSNTINSTWTYTLTVEKSFLTACKEVGDTDSFRTKCSAQEAIDKWDHIIYKVRFRYMTDSTHKKILNSDEIDVYCTFDGWVEE